MHAVKRTVKYSSKSPSSSPIITKVKNELCKKTLNNTNCIMTAVSYWVYILFRFLFSYMQHFVFTIFSLWNAYLVVVYFSNLVMVVVVVGEGVFLFDWYIFYVDMSENAQGYFDHLWWCPLFIFTYSNIAKTAQGRFKNGKCSIRVNYCLFCELI